MSQENADEMNEIGSISSGSLEPPPEDLEDNNETGGDDNNNENNPDTEGERLESIPTSPPKRAQATPLPPKTNIDARLTQAQQSYNPDPSRQRSKDVGVLTTKFRQFRVHLNELKPILKSYQEAHKDLHSARTKLYAELTEMSIESPFFEMVGKRLDADALSETATIEAASQVAEESQTHSLVSVHQVAQAPLPVLEAEYQDELVGYILEWQAVVANKVDSLMKANEDLRLKQVHYRTKLDKLREEKSQSDLKNKEFPNRKREKLVRNEEKYRQAMKEHEEKASELCHMLESVVNLAWQDMMPLVQQTILWERKRYDIEDASYGTMIRSVLESLEEEIARVEEEESTKDLEAALTIQREKHEVLKEKLNRLQMALSGDWETKNELFRKFDLM